jgi:hypothetical protein
VILKAIGNTRLPKLFPEKTNSLLATGKGVFFYSWVLTLDVVKKELFTKKA